MSVESLSECVALACQVILLQDRPARVVLASEFRYHITCMTYLTPNSVVSHPLHLLYGIQSGYYAIALQLVSIYANTCTTWLPFHLSILWRLRDVSLQSLVCLSADVLFSSFCNRLSLPTCQLRNPQRTLRKHVVSLSTTSGVL